MVGLVASSRWPVTDRRRSEGTRQVTKPFALYLSIGLNTQGRRGILRMYQSCPSVYCQAVSPSGGELGFGHPFLHSADKWAVFPASSWGSQREVDRPQHRVTRRKAP